MFQVLRTWPEFSRQARDLLSVVPKPLLSIDLEWSVRTNKPTIVGVSNGEWGVSCSWDEGKVYFRELLRRHPNVDILTYNGISSDAPVLAEEGIPIPLERHQDGILWHFLTNMSLCKGTKKADDEEGEKRGRGWMNLYAACSFYLSVPRWKDCVGEPQCTEESRPCPERDPWAYNYNDCHWIARAFPAMRQRAQLMGVDKLYPLHRDLMDALYKIREKGVLINVPYVDSLRGQFEDDCKKIAESFPFNPNSPPQVRAHFAKKGITLANAQQTTIDEASEDYPDDEELARLCEYGELGNGPDRWFAPREFDYKKNEWKGYVDGNGFIHGNLQPFTSSARLAMSNPNLQNISHRPKKHEVGPDGKLKDPENALFNRIRRAIVAPEGYYLVEADYSNAENRAILHQAGYQIPADVDLHLWVAEMAEFKPEDPFCIKEGSPRQAAKTIQHGTMNGEGIQLISPTEFRSSRIQNEISRNLRIAYPNWTFEGQIVTFTGINFARRAFGSSSFENRIRANTVINKYFSKFPGVRELQKATSNKLERERCFGNNLGYVVASYGYPAERIKIACAFNGQNPVAHATKLAILNSIQHPRLDLRLQIHDSLLYYVDKRHEPAKVKEWIREAMEVTMEDLGGLKIPVDVKIGPDWASLKKV